MHLSHTLVQKLKRTETGIIEESPCPPTAQIQTIPDIVDLFNIKIDKIDELTNQIRKNINQSIDVIE